MALTRFRRSGTSGSREIEPTEGGSPLRRYIYAHCVKTIEIEPKEDCCFTSIRYSVKASTARLQAFLVSSSSGPGLNILRIIPIIEKWTLNGWIWIPRTLAFDSTKAVKDKG